MTLRLLLTLKASHAHSTVQQLGMCAQALTIVIPAAAAAAAGGDGPATLFRVCLCSQIMPQDARLRRSPLGVVQDDTGEI
jgi:hypothetical protein